MLSKKQDFHHLKTDYAFLTENIPYDNLLNRSYRMQKGLRMLITRECDYALRIIRNLSTEYVQSIKAVAEKEKITNAIAYKVAGKLEKGGLIRSVRGNRGGYMLSRCADRISILDVYRIMEPDGVINECLKEGSDCPMNRGETPCAVHRELKRVQKVLFSELGKKSLQEIENGAD